MSTQTFLTSEVHELDAPVRVACEELESFMRLYKSMKEKKDSLEKELAMLKEHIILEMGQSTTLASSDGEILATWNWSKPVKRFDSKALKEVMPEVYKQFMFEGQPVRTFLAK